MIENKTAKTPADGPVAWMHTTGTGHVYFRKKPQDKVFNPQPVFTAAPKAAEWVGLTDEEIQDLSYLSQKIDEGNAAWFDRWGFARAIEAKLKEKNHG
jgi:acyl transferase domain-containing protein